MSKPTLKLGELPNIIFQELGIAVDPQLQVDLKIHAQFYGKPFSHKASVTALSPSTLRSLLSVTAGLKGLDTMSSKLLPKSTQIERSQSWQP